MAVDVNKVILVVAPRRRGLARAENSFAPFSQRAYGSPGYRGIIAETRTARTAAGMTRRWS